MATMEHLKVLEEKINSLLSSVKQLREQNIRLTRDNKSLQEQLDEKGKSSGEIEDLKNKLKDIEEENRALLEERDSVKSRIEALISDLDSIDLSESTSEVYSDEK